MKIYQKVLWVIALVAFGALSLGGLLVSAGILPKILIFSALTAMELGILIRIGVSVVFIFLLGLSIYLPIVTWTEGKGTTIPLRNPLGEIEISQKAICEFIQRVGKEVQGVEDLKAKVKSTEEGVDVDLTLAAHAQGEIPRLIDELQNVIKNYLNNTVGIENVREIRVKVGKIL
ncbi:alkaline shock response membrane anchor protein AmaP [Candidatus Aerophobetes bacterium]|nr:alkaline shock response membrane anchor protein AmaP [Candidatus Aerophobetes bacterium]